MKLYWHRNICLLLLVLFVVGGLLLAIEAWFDTGSAKITGFYVAIGFLGCMVLIVIALLIAKIMRRKGGYYDL